MNYDYLSDVDFDLMTEEEFLNYLDEKAKYLREKNFIVPLPPYHQRLAKAVSGCYDENKQNKNND